MKPSVARSRCLEDSGLPYLKRKRPEGKKPAWRELTGPTGSGSPLSRGQPRFLMCYSVLCLATSSRTACCFHEAGHILPFLLSIRMFSSFPGLSKELLFKHQSPVQMSLPLYPSKGSPSLAKGNRMGRLCSHCTLF